jgi:hypothetical protein
LAFQDATGHSDALEYGQCVIPLLAPDIPPAILS